VGSRDQVGEADHAGTGVRPQDGADLGEQDVEAGVAPSNTLAKLLRIGRRGAVHDGELADVAVSLEQFHQLAKRLRPPARPPDGDDLAVFQLKDRLHIQQGSE